MSRNLHLLGLAATFALGSMACTEKTDPVGQLMLAVTTDMYINKDMGRVDIVVQPENGPTQSTQVNLFPEVDGKFLPGTFAVIEGAKENEFVRIRVIARKGNTVRVVREAATKVPKARSAVLPMPIQWLCDGEVKEDSQLYKSDCEEADHTCVSGACQTAVIDEADLEDYKPAEVFGGGNATGGGECFEVLECLANAVSVAVDLENCQIHEPDDVKETNVALVLPPGNDGHCTANECLIPLDRAKLGGWFSVDDGEPGPRQEPLGELDGSVPLPSMDVGDGARLQLPVAVCDRIISGEILGIKVSSSGCESKQQGMPTCGPWTLVGTEPGEEPTVIDLDPGSTGSDGGVPPGDENNGENVVGPLTDNVQALTDSIAEACAAITASSAPSPASLAEVTELCTDAALALQPVGGPLWFHTPVTCAVNDDTQFSCERDCAAACEPGSVPDRCPAENLAGLCDGACSGRFCEGSSATKATCQGACFGECDGECLGTCVGACELNCSDIAGDGFCQGSCESHCTGLCEGRCDGVCAGDCDQDPRLPAASCGEDVICRGGCEDVLREPRCENQLAAVPCELAPGCAADCSALGGIDATCSAVQAWVMPRGDIDSNVRLALENYLGALLVGADGKGPILSFVVSELGARLDASSDSDSLLALRAQVDEAAALLEGALKGASEVLAVMGAPRGMAGGIPPVGTPAADAGVVIPAQCSTVTAEGAPPLIDDFEDGNSSVLPNDSRTGEWTVFGNGGELSPSPGPLVPMTLSMPRGDSLHGVHVMGSGVNGGAGVRFDFSPGNLYDAGSYQGLRFYASGPAELFVVFHQASLSALGPCGSCDPGTSSCRLYSVQSNLPAAWTLVDIPFEGLQAQADEPDKPFNARELIGISFEAPSTLPFDFWIDDVELY